MADQFCFCTLAVGNRYRAHAHMLAQDIQYYAPAHPFIILTDRPAEFEAYANVCAIQHRLQSIKGYHDKRFVIQHALCHFEVCLYLDSDVRLLGPVPLDMEWQPGITARTGCNILKHNANPNLVGKQRRALPIIKQAAHKLNINLEHTRWFHEFMFAVKKQSGAEAKFLEMWQTLAYFFEMQGIYDGEGNVMGLAAAKAGLTVRLDQQDRFAFFKDNIETIRIQNGQSKLEDKHVYFDAHNIIEYPDQTAWQKGINRLKKKLAFLGRWLRLRYAARRDAGLRALR